MKAFLRHSPLRGQFAELQGEMVVFGSCLLPRRFLLWLDIIVAIFSGGSRKFWWGGFEAKTSKIRMSSPKLRLIFRPKSEIQTFFSPKIRWSPKKKKKRS